MTTININNNDNLLVETSTAVSTAPTAETPVATAAHAVSSEPANASPVAQSNVASPPIYRVPPTVEAAHTDNDEIIVRSRKDFVALYRTCEAKTALATLEMCRAVYEAFKILSEAEFEAFCKEIGHKDESSTIRKFLAIGKVAPRLVAVADRLPASWTSIYMLTQIPASTFERLVEEGKVFKALKTSQVADLVKATRVHTNITGPLQLEKDLWTIRFATVAFTKTPIDDVDWRAMRKAFAEIESRLPIRFRIDPRAEDRWLRRKDAMYEQTKTKYELDQFRPDRWDFGREANVVARMTLPVSDNRLATPDCAEQPAQTSKPEAA